MPGTTDSEEQPVAADPSVVGGSSTLEAQPDHVFTSYDELSDLMKEYARVHNFRLKVERHEKTQGSNLWRGKFFCGGCNKKKVKGAQPAMEPCTFCVPFTYVANGEHRVKDQTGKATPVCWGHNHAMHGLLWVNDMMEQVVTHKQSRQQLTDEEIAVIRLEKGSHTDIKTITVTELTD